MVYEVFIFVWEDTMKKAATNSLKPRNHIVSNSIGRGGAGVHGKSRKAERRGHKVDLRKSQYD
jgi:hypothetical protein